MQRNKKTSANAEQEKISSRSAFARHFEPRERAKQQRILQLKMRSRAVGVPLVASRYSRASSLHARAAVACASVSSSHASVAARKISFDLSEDDLMIQETARRFARDVIMPAAPELDRTGEYPTKIFAQLHELGLVNCHVPEAYGGPGLNSLQNVLVTEELAYACSGVSTAASANDLAQAPVLLAGTEEQKKKYLGWCTAEPIQCSYGVTEPIAGSDVAAIRTRAERKGEDWVINGSKMWITNSGFAKWFFVLAKTDPDAKAGKAFTAFIVDADTPGLTGTWLSQLLVFHGRVLTFFVISTSRCVL